MGLFRRRQREDADLATIIGRRGIPSMADILAMQETGRTRQGGAAREFDFRLSYTPHGRPPVEVAVRQFMSELNLKGLAPGSPATILYDRSDPQTVVVTGSPSYKIVSEGVAVKVEGAASGLARPWHGPT